MKEKEVRGGAGGGKGLRRCPLYFPPSFPAGAFAAAAFSFRNASTLSHMGATNAAMVVAARALAASCATTS